MAITVAARAVDRYQRDPCAFAREVLRQSIWFRQSQILKALADPNVRYIAVKAGQKTSKSVTAAMAALWWPSVFPRGLVRLTAPTYDTVKDIIWREVRRIYEGAARQGIVLGPAPALDPATGWRLPGERGIMCVSANKPEAAAGRSGVNQLYIIDEASGYPEDLWEVVFGNLQGGGKLLALSNPTQPTGTFYKAFHEGRELWYTVTIDARENPNFPDEPGSQRAKARAEVGAAEAEPPIPGCATPEGVALITAQYGEESPFHDVRVRGDFPRQGSNAVVPLFLVEASARRFASSDKGSLEIGVDVARFGDDDSVIQPRRDNWAPAPRVIHGQDVVQVAGAVLEVVRQYRRGNEPVRVKVDVVGVGAGVADILRQHETEGIEVIDVNVAEAPTTHEDGRPEFALLRDQLWFAIGDWLKSGGAIEPGQAKLEGELVAPTYSFDVRGRVKVERKEDVKKRLRRSTDRADALALAIYSPPAVISAYDSTYDDDLPQNRI